MVNDIKDQDQEAQDPSEERTFLCLVDDTEEFSPTLRFVCRRAMNTGGRIALLYIIQPAEFQHWLGVGDLMKQESREQAEEMCNVVADVVLKQTGKIPVIYIREGQAHEVLAKLIEEESSLSVLVLGASTKGEGPGPIVSHIVNKVAGGFALPITIVPGGLSDEEIDAIT
ncbi:MAG: universal stress protein [Rhodospirillales bacterium]|nr:universal stress protein [Rhodospirillales bacterium]